MEKFIRFREEIDMAALQRAQTNPQIIVLRKSQATNTIQIKVPEGMSAKQIKQAFGSFHVEKIYDEFPYPVGRSSWARYIIDPFLRLIHKLF